MWSKIIHPESPEKNRAWISATDRAFGGRNSTTFPENIRIFLACCKKLGDSYSATLRKVGKKKACPIFDHVLEICGRE
jgi:hypothetical protein